MNKKQVQKRILQNGKPLALSKFTWCGKTKTLSTKEVDLVLDFKDINYVTFDTGSGCTFDTDYGCTFNTGSDCTFKTGSGCTFNTGSDCTFNTGSDRTFKTGSYCTFKTGSDCTFKTGHGCTFKTGSGCTFNTGYGCTFKTGSDCTFNTGYGCTFEDIKENCVIVRRGIFQVIQPNVGDTIQLCPYDIEGYLVNGLYNGEPHIIADGILSKIISKKGDIYKVINHGETKHSYLIKQGDIYSHGATIKDARDNLLYKISDRDTSKYSNYTLETTLTKAECIQLYRTVTGACEEGTRYFAETAQYPDKDTYTVKELIAITSGQYGNNELKNFIESK